MPPLTAEQFVQALRKVPLEKIVDEHVFAGTEFFFQDAPEDLASIKESLNRKLGCATENITIVGSAKVGFSLDPDNFPRVFMPTSDIDIVVVDPVFFDKFWHVVLKWHYMQGRFVGAPDREWAAARKEEIFWGWLEPHKVSYRGLLQRRGYAISALQQMSHDWFTAFQGLGRIPSLRGRDISGRLYRSWDHARRFHVMGLEKIKIRILRR